MSVGRVLAQVRGGKRSGDVCEVERSRGVETAVAGVWSSPRMASRVQDILPGVFLVLLRTIVTLRSADGAPVCATRCPHLGALPNPVVQLDLPPRRPSLRSSGLEPGAGHLDTCNRDLCLVTSWLDLLVQTRGLSALLSCRTDDFQQGQNKFDIHQNLFFTRRSSTELHVRPVPGFTPTNAGLHSWVFRLRTFPMTHNPEAKRQDPGRQPAERRVAAGSLYPKQYLLV